MARSPVKNRAMLAGLGWCSVDRQAAIHPHVREVCVARGGPQEVLMSMPAEAAYRNRVARYRREGCRSELAPKRTDVDEVQRWGGAGARRERVEGMGATLDVGVRSHAVDTVG